MSLYRWIPDRGENLGDWLSVPILRALGHEPESPESGKPCLVAVGSILHPNHYAASKASAWTVWGSGIGSPERPTIPLHIRAVRGPMTRDALRLSDDTPLGDPALLLPRLVKLPEPPERGEVLYVRHIGDDDGHDLDGAVGVSTRTTVADGLALVARIAAARFVASESMHGCIVAAAYGVPWSPASARWIQPAPPKWCDWLSYLGLRPFGCFPHTLAEAFAWWERIGRHGRVGELDPLLDAFPES